MNTLTAVAMWTAKRPSQSALQTSPAPEVKAEEHTQNATLLSLPTELHLQILSLLAYPDVLAMSLTNCHFRALAMPHLTVVSRVTWLLERAQANLPIPKTGQLSLHSDAAFLKNREVQGILRARRRHEECRERGVGCLIRTGLEYPVRKVRFWESERGRSMAVWYFGRVGCRSGTETGVVSSGVADRDLGLMVRMGGVRWWGRGRLWSGKKVVSVLVGFAVLLLSILLATMFTTLCI